MAYRIDTVPIKNHRFDAETGDMIVTGTARHSGVYGYRNLDGTMRYEFVPPELLIARDDSGRLYHSQIATRPLTHEHPSQPLGTYWVQDSGQTVVGEPDPLVDIYDEGEMDQRVRRVDVRVRVRADSAKQAVIAGDIKGFSCGYETNLKRQDGVFQGQRYTHIQIPPLRFDHLALVGTPRAPKALINHYDSAQQCDDLGWCFDPQEGFSSVSIHADADGDGELFDFMLRTGKLIKVNRQLWRVLRSANLGKDAAKTSCGCKGH